MQETLADISHIKDVIESEMKAQDVENNFAFGHDIDMIDIVYNGIIDMDPISKENLLIAYNYASRLKVFYEKAYPALLNTLNYQI